MENNKPKIATQGQWEDLVQRVKDADEVKTLSSSDYNWPIATPDGVSLWNLDTGIYHIPNGVKAYYYDSNSTSGGTRIVLVAQFGNSTYKASLYFLGAGGIEAYSVLDDGSLGSHNTLLDDGNIENNLTTTTAGSVLDARQGKALDDKIPVITLTDTDPGEGSPLAANHFIGVYASS